MDAQVRVAPGQVTPALEAAAVTPAAPVSRKKLVRLAVLALAVAGAAAYGSHWWLAGRFIEDTDDAYIGAEVTVISAKVPGYITEVAVVDNQFVKAGDLLARIDVRDYRTALAKAEGAVAAQRASLANLAATEQLQQALISQAGSQIDASEAEAQRAHDDHARYQTLVRSQAVSVESAQRADATWKTAQAERAHAQAGLLAARRQLAVIDTQRQQAQAMLEQAQAERDQAQLNLGYTELRAPVDGYVGNRRAKVGAYAAAGSQLVSVVPAHGLWVDANFKEDQLSRMQIGQAVSVKADILPGREFHGHIESLAPATGAQFSVLPPENATGNFTKIVQRVPVRIRLDGDDADFGALRPGLSVMTEVNTRDKPETLPAVAQADRP
ncbi:HlyD family secretion protein [Pseudomonas gingeri]|uniref:HlyD family secretion protein n=1 Tax=Pseudomonas gingeri TaxID=117681 RepID=UPI0015A01AF8|nr:HlyD family secretion protein [Pseudomonas gingeri]NWA02221.1 HlyD family secretion protein [Pseudomonas gingeri]NWA17910.1 HlyD family secretion protein [Pseudomonas gingeri]NWA56823.1 HlyD family secretion protein [Pseudomonas gingeri]NWA97126.1 HlyD family secretion protein [Pseudomonas gingeri]NWB03673.1 HlyD family secretion protein [Pseudomonas gingeri]